MVHTDDARWSRFIQTTPGGGQADAIRMCLCCSDDFKGGVAFICGQVVIASGWFQFPGAGTSGPGHRGWGIGAGTSGLGHGGRDIGAAVNV